MVYLFIPKTNESNRILSSNQSTHGLIQTFLIVVSMNNTKNGNSDTNYKFGYKIGRKIGDGTFSKVKLAYSYEHKMTVALKIIHKSRASSRFNNYYLPREIEVVKYLRHPNIINYIQCIETDKRVYIAMEYANNGTLLNLITDVKLLPEKDAQFYFRQLVSAMIYCHSRSIAHRDLKLENLLLTNTHCLKVSDFSFARYFNGDKRLSQTFCGSNAYICPEILKQIPYHPLMADVWSSGVILFALVTGCLPFNDTESVAQLIKLTDRGVMFPHQTNISRDCEQLIFKLLTPELMRISMSTVGDDVWMCKNFV